MSFYAAYLLVLIECCSCILLVLVALAIGLGGWYASRGGDDGDNGCTSSSGCLGIPTGICDNNECIGCQDIGYTSLDCLMYSFSDSTGEAREDCYDFCAAEGNFLRYGNLTITNSTKTD